MSKVITNVWVTKDGYPVLLRAGDTVPDGVTVTNPAALDEADADADADEADADESEADESEADADEAPAPRKRAPRKAAASE